MKVAIVTNSLTGGGAERAMNHAANALHDAGIEVLLIPINKGAQDLVKVIPRTLSLEHNSQRSVFKLVKVIFLFRKYLALEKPDLLFLNCDLPELLGCFTAFKTRLFVVEHANPSWSTRQVLGHLIRAFLRFRGATFGAVSDHLSIWPRGNKPEFIVPNLITLKPQIEIPFLKSLKIQRIVFIGRLALVQKRPDWVIEIAKQTSISALIIGEGSARNYLQKKVDALKLDVNFVDFQENPWDLINPGDLLVVPSSFEGDGLVVLEGIMRYMPILVSDIQDFRRFCFPEVNYCKNVEAFVERLQLFEENSDALVVPLEITHRILETRSPKNVLNSWMKVIYKS
jgi:glycosyltransferase involved in cell wall biosynthesis